MRRYQRGSYATILLFLRAPTSIFPILVGEWSCIQLLTTRSPFWQKSIHQHYETIIVVTFKQMGQFVNNDVFNALGRLLDKFKLQPNSVGIDVASPPPRLHSLDSPFSDGNTHHILPLLDDGTH